MKMVPIRKAKETDRNNVALCIAEAFGVYESGKTV